MTTSNRKYHRGLGVDLWTKGGAWFWQLAGRCCGAGAIGSALTENEALREAYAAVEEASARCGRAAPTAVSAPATSISGHRDRGLAAKLGDGAENSARKYERDTGDC